MSRYRKPRKGKKPRTRKRREWEEALADRAAADTTPAVPTAADDALIARLETGLAVVFFLIFVTAVGLLLSVL